MQPFSPEPYNRTQFPAAREHEARVPGRASARLPAELLRLQPHVRETRSARALPTMHRRNCRFRDSCSLGVRELCEGSRCATAIRGETQPAELCGSGRPAARNRARRLRMCPFAHRGRGCPREIRVSPWRWPCSSARWMTSELRRACVYAVPPPRFIASVWQSRLCRGIRSHAPDPSAEGHGDIVRAAARVRIGAPQNPRRLSAGFTLRIR
jgi:hypothetical protein